MTRLPDPDLEAARTILDQMIKDPMGGTPAVYVGMAHNPGFLDIFRFMSAQTRERTALDPTDRELIIHRVSALCGQRYEWGVHATLLAGPLGLDDAWLEATWSGAPEDFERAEHRALCAACDGLHATARVSDATWALLRERFTEAQIVEILFLVGYYHLVCFTENALEIPEEPWTRPAPDAPGAGRPAAEAR